MPYHDVTWSIRVPMPLPRHATSIYLPPITTNCHASFALRHTHHHRPHARLTMQTCGKRSPHMRSTRPKTLRRYGTVQYAFTLWYSTAVSHPYRTVSRPRLPPRPRPLSRV